MWIHCVYLEFRTSLNVLRCILVAAGGCHEEWPFLKVGQLRTSGSGRATCPPVCATNNGRELALTSSRLTFLVDVFCSGRGELKSKFLVPFVGQSRCCLSGPSILGGPFQTGRLGRGDVTVSVETQS